MHAELNAEQIETMLKGHRFGRLAFSLDEELYIMPINYAYDGVRLYGHASAGESGNRRGGTKMAGMRQNPHVAFQIDEITDPAHWRSVLVQGRYHELHGRDEKKQALSRIQAQAGGGEQSEASWAMNIDELAVFSIEITQRHGRIEQREPMSFGSMQRRIEQGRPARDFRFQAGL